MPKRKRIIIIAGPNGAGKTTFAREYLLKEANCPDFINVDLIAAGLSPFNPDRVRFRRGGSCCRKSSGALEREIASHLKRR
jgi:predicted ABC-type ATPase